MAYSRKDSLPRSPGLQLQVPALPATIVKHAVTPGIAVQALEEALPDSQAGQTLQKAYPIARRGLPVALAAQRYLGKRILPQ